MDSAAPSAHAASKSTWPIASRCACLGTLAGDGGSHREATRLFSAAHAARQRMGAVRFKVWDVGYEASVAPRRWPATWGAVMPLHAAGRRQRC